MSGPWIQAGGFENVLPFIILTLWIVGKVMNARAEGRAKRQPGQPPPMPERDEPAGEPAPSGEEQLRRFLAELTGTEPPPVHAPPPEPLPEPPPLPVFRPPTAARPPVASSMPAPNASPDPFSLRRSLAERQRRRRMRPAPPPPAPVAAPVRTPAPFRESVATPAETVTVIGPQARRAVMPASGLQGITMAGPHMGSIGRLPSVGRSHATWNLHPRLANRHALKEAMILQTLLSPPRALDPI